MAVCEGDYAVSVNELIASPNAVYEVLDFLGRGTFGQVLKAWRRDTNEVVALKILKNIPSYAKQGRVEVDVLTKLSKVSAEEFNFVRAYESFTHHSHICIVFEMLQINLYDYLKQSHFQPLTLKHIRPIAQQVLTCLQKMRELGLVHADLKPENIMLVDPVRQPFRVKVIDFGSATPRSKSNATTYLQSRYYRAPEIILGLPYGEAIDMWSLGCVLTELYLGWPLFPGSSEYDQILYISQTLGAIPDSMLRNLNKVSRFFTRDLMRGRWTVKSPHTYETETGIQWKESRRFIFKSISDIAGSCHGNHNGSVVHQLDCLQFVSLLGSMLQLDPSQRILPSSALQHPFITMQHLAMHTNSLSVREWIQCMQVCCQARTTTSPRDALHYVHLPPPPLSCPPPALHMPPYPHVAYPIAPSTLCYLPHSTEHTHHEHSQSSWSELDTGYVSADSSPTTVHFTTDGMEVPVFFADPIITTPSHLHHPPPPPPYVFNPPMFQPELYTLVQLGHPPLAATHPNRLHLQPLHQ